VTTVVGTSMVRGDAADKARGAAVYAIDHEEARQLHAKLLRSPVPSGRIVRLDVARAKAMPGVRGVVTAADAPGRTGWIVADQPLMASEVVRFAGEPIACVAADTEAQAAAAVAAIELEIEPLPAVVDLDAAVADGSPLVHPDWETHTLAFAGPRGGNVSWEVDLERGDVEAGFAAADVVVEDEYVVPRQHQLYLEPRACVARYEHGRYVVHTTTQYAFNVRKTTAAYLGVREAAVRVVVTAVGGGFGGKLDATLEPFCCLLARRTGRPVKLVNTRREEFVAGAPRENAVVRIRSAVDREGRILARDAECLLDAGAYSGEGPFCVANPPLVLAATYRLDAARVRSRLVYTNTAPTGAFRGVQATYCVFAVEQHMDHIAREIGMDRRELRLRNVLGEGDEGPTGQRLDDPAFEDAFAAVERLAPWGERADIGFACQAPGLRPVPSATLPLRGVGIAATMWSTFGGPASASLKLNEDGTVAIITAGTEIGSGAMTTAAVQVVAEELGMRPEDVVLLPVDTDVAGYDMGVQGSRTAYNVGNALRTASAQVRDQVLAVAAQALEIAPDDLELVDSAVQPVGDPARAMSMAAIAQTGLWSTGPIMGQGAFVSPPLDVPPGCTVGSLIPGIHVPTYHVHLAEVEVDPGTGRVTIVRYVVAQDVGRILNEAQIEGQIQGAVLQGVGYALYENLRMEGGQYLDTTLETYRVPTALDAPPIEIALLEHPSPDGPYGAKGVAEPPIIPVAAAVSCAITDAIGVPFNRLPITPFDVLAALRSR
jgi:CO/xanthine dehydrogenase Mo-binding subunit